MTHYRYRAAAPDGRIRTGLLEAPGSGQAGTILLDRGLHPVRIEETTPRASGANAKLSDLAIVFRSIAALVSAGVPLERAVAATEPLARGPLIPMLQDARRMLREGRSFGNALESGHLVPRVVIGMVRAGERGSQLSGALDQAAAHLEHEADLVARLRQALAYPLLLVITGTISVLVIGTVVVPRFAGMLADLGQKPPLSTRMLLGGSALLRDNGLLVVAFSVALITVVTAWMRQPAGQLAWHRTLLRLPVIGSVRLGVSTARLCRSLGGMLAAGMPLLPALDAAADAAADREVGERVARARERVIRGEPLAGSLRLESAVTETAAQLLQVGEGSGRLAQMAERAGMLAATEAERSLRTALTLIEPVLIIAFGGAVALVAVALLQAVYSIRPGG